MAAPAKGTPLAWPLGRALAVLQCAPRARTKGRAVLRIRQSASKNVPATGKGWERFARIARPFTAEGEAITNERLARSTALSQATGCERHIAEALTFRSPRDVARAPSPSPLRRF